jgi:hypothetical protein
LCYVGRYSGPSAAHPAVLLPIFKEPQLRSETPSPLAVNLKDRECGISALVGGKGASLALMTTVEENKVNINNSNFYYHNYYDIFLTIN